MKRGHWVDFELNVTGMAEQMHVRVGHFDERAVASVAVGRITTSGIGATAREALVAALAPLGARTMTAVMAAPVMFGASAQLLATAD